MKPSDVYGHHAMSLPRALLVALALTSAACSANLGEPISGAGDPSTTTPGTVPPEPRVAVELEGPITGGERDVLYNAMPKGFEAHFDYTEEEWFVSGEATAFEVDGSLDLDGTWSVRHGDTAPYTTRIVVRRPIDPDDFNGIVLVEWNNVTVGRDADPGFGFLFPEILGKGYAYIGVSAQEVGIVGDARLEIPGPSFEAADPLKVWDPERYAPLTHPGDAYAYDIFTQVGAIATVRADANPLDGLDPEAVIAIGGSEAASRLVTYANAIQPEAGVYDALLIHSRGGGAAPLGPDLEMLPRNGTRVRADLRVPVLILETETDLGILDFQAARQPDTDHIVTWEVAGAAQSDQATLNYSSASASRWNGARSAPGVQALCGPINVGPQPEVARAALARLRAWVVHGRRPPLARPLETTPDGEIARDADGNALGGVRTPAVDAPISSLTGEGGDAGIFCALFGQERPFTPARLAELYPTHRAYTDAVTESADTAMDGGFLLKADRDAIVAKAERSNVGR